MKQNKRGQRFVLAVSCLLGAACTSSDPKPVTAPRSTLAPPLCAVPAPGATYLPWHMKGTPLP
ncbi:MAG TPA: hypothetical protein VE174_14215, partial [Actinomycetota bacterium]|nr:hypothetical protein [Actinomycetota bacterium]